MVIRRAHKKEVCVLFWISQTWYWWGEAEPEFKILVKGETAMAVPTGTVSVTDTIGGTTVATGTLDSTGAVSLTWTAITGTYNFVANYGGDANFDPGVSTAVPYTVTSVLQNVTVSLSAVPADTAPAGTAVAFASTVVGA